MQKQREGTKTVESIYRRIREILETARSSAYRAVNFAMVQAYWHIGREIIEEEQKGKKRAEYGEYLIRQLSEKLTSDSGKGFTITNLKYMRQFYIKFPIRHAVRDQSHFTATPAGLYPELSWTHYRLLLKVEQDEVRQFYLNECIQNNWSTRQLERQINTFYYERILSSRDKKAVRKEIHKLEPSLKPEDIIKDLYVLEFLNVKENIRFLEKDLENALNKTKGDTLAKRTRKKKEDVEAYRHETETRKNAVPVGLASYDTSTLKPKKYEYDPHLAPQLVWTGKTENTSFEVPTVSLHIHERIGARDGSCGSTRSDRGQNLHDSWA